MAANNRQIISFQAQLEAFLFHYGEPVGLKKVMRFFDLEENDCRKLLDEWEGKLAENPERGLTLLRNAGEIQLVTKPELQNVTQKLIEEEFKEELSGAATETLAIIAYLGPLPRAKIDYIRGVNSSFTLRNLLVRGLIQRETASEGGNVYEYRVSFDFLKHMGLSKIEELPEYEKYRDFVKNLEMSGN